MTCPLTVRRSPAVLALPVFAGLGLSIGLPIAGDQGLGAEVEGRVGAVLATWNRADSPGCAVGIFRHGQLVYGRGYGMANLEQEVPITTQTRFGLASTSKQFTAFAIHLLARDGALALDDDIREYLPEVPDYGTTIELRHLIHHTSGIRNYLVLLQYAGVQPERDWVSLEETLSLIVGQRGVEFAPGERFAYSNSGYWLLAEVLERVSGVSMAEFCRRRIFEPLGMSRTLVQDDLFQVIPGVAQSYRRSGGGFEIHRDSFLAKGDGWVFSCIEDLARWDRNFEEPVVGSAELVRDVLQPWIFSDGSGGARLAEYRVQGSARGQVFTAIASISSLQDLAREVQGSYSSEDLGVTYVLSPAEGGVVVTIPGPYTDERSTAAPVRSGSAPGRGRGSALRVRPRGRRFSDRFQAVVARRSTRLRIHA